MSGIETGAPFAPDWVSLPGDTIADVLAERGWSCAELARRMGCTEAHISQIINGEARITEETASGLARVIGGTAGFWLRKEAAYRARLSALSSSSTASARERAMKADYRRHPDPEYRFFLYDPEGYGFMFFRSAEERDAAAGDAIHAYLDDVWAEEVEGVFAGEVTHHTIRTNVTMKPKREDFDSEEDFEDALAEFGDSDCDYACNYELRPLTESDEPVGDDHD